MEPMKPKTPTRNASIAQVQEYLIKFCSYKYRGCEDWAEEYLIEARRSPLDGQSLFSASEQRLVTLFGYFGSIVFDEIQGSKPVPPVVLCA